MISVPPSALDLKIDRWRKSLLDMTFRNRLLNFKPRSAVPLIQPAPAVLFDGLVGEERTLTVVEAAEGAPTDVAAVGAGEVLTPFDPKGVQDGLKRMRLKARGHLQEQGSNILYVAVGVVRWFEGPKSTEELLSPLVLVPVELIKDGPLEPFKIRIIDEDIVANPNLLFKLTIEYGLRLPEWSDDRSLTEHIALARSVLAACPRWTINEVAYLGLFSFAKLSMYRELVDEHDHIAAHPFINALAGDPSMLPLVPDQPTAERMDALVRPYDSFQVLDADSSQQEAIEMAKLGMSFVLQGPPGTGKSQTITNIIAESLAAERKVLFVSEKMAALEVVEKRLDDRGLGDYTLEIHSRKTSKTTIMDEIRRSMVPLPLEAVATDDLARLERAREELNRYVVELHEPRGTMGLSAFAVHGRIARLSGAADLPVAVAGALSMGPADLDDRLRLVRRVQTMLPTIERMDGHPWRDLRTEGWKAGDEVMVGGALREAGESIARCRGKGATLGSLSGMGPPTSMREARRVIEMAERAVGSPLPEPSWMVPGRPEALATQASRFEDLYLKQQYHQQWISGHYAKGVWSLDVREMSFRFDQDYRGALRILNGRYRADLRSMRSLRRDGQSLGYQEAASDLRRLVAADEHERRVREAEATGTRDFGPRFKGPATDWAKVKRDLAWTSQFLADLGTAPTGRTVGMVTDPGARSEIVPAIRDATSAEKEAERALESLERLFVIDAPEGLPALPFVRLEEMVARHLEAMGSIREWIEVATLERTCQDSGLGEVFDLGRKRRLPPGDLTAAYEKRAFRAWLDQAYIEEPRLGEFRSDAHEETIALFRRLDERQMEIARRRLTNLLNARREKVLGATVAKASEMGILRHEAAKKKRFKQIRQLFQDCPNAILALKPCLLMSPLSVSTFLDPTKVTFDLVIFDEASQVRPEDAIGSIMRARQVIVVGDSKQLPPTDFFRSGTGEDEDEMGDLESILDECTALSVKQAMLLWHYRSRHESLIAFSNHHIYDGRLFTFPSAGRQEGEWGVSYERVPDGVYDRAGTRTNQEEARKVAELVFEHFEKSPDRTLGVVAFSEPQQMAILDRLDAMRRDRPEFERFFAEGGLEEFFVKNLENVQGDERDVMIFSVGYGRDENGRMSQNFGPLNKAGGERRLNVAITRAKMRAIIVASIGADDVIATGSQGTRLLNDYLAYAASGGSREVLQVNPVQKYDLDLPLEDDVHRALVAEGMKVRRQVGCSGYRIDLAVEDPQRPGTFLLGIECDGSSYRSGKTARDRDRIRWNVLRGLGWSMHRIWSRDWIIDRGSEVEKVKVALAKALGTKAGDALGSEEAGPEKETFLPALLNLVRERGPVHVDIAKDVLDDHVRHPEDVDKVLSEHLYALVRDGTVAVRDGFIWPGEMVVPRVRRPPGREPMELDYVSVEEIGEAELYCMGVGFHTTRGELVERTASFYRHETLTEKARTRLEAGIDNLISRGRLLAPGGDVLLRAR